MGHERVSHGLCVEIIEHEHPVVAQYSACAIEYRSVLRVVGEVAEASEEVHDQVEGPIPKRQPPHVSAHQVERRVLTVSREAQQRHGQIEADDPGAAIGEVDCVTPGAAGQVQYAAPPVRGMTLDQRRQLPRFIVVAVRIQPQVLLAEPLLEPLRHSWLPLWYGSPRRMVSAR